MNVIYFPQLGLYFNGRISVSKTDDPGSNPGGPANYATTKENSIKRLQQIWQGDTTELTEKALKDYPPKNIKIVNSPRELQSFISSIS